MGLGGGDRPVLNSSRHDKYFAWADRNDSVAKLNVNPTAENEKEIIRIIVLVPYELTLDLNNHEIVSIEFAHDARLPEVCEGGELIGQVDRLHG